MPRPPHDSAESFLRLPSAGRGASFPVLVSIPPTWIQFWKQLGAMGSTEMICINCGYEHATSPDQCPLCKGEWQGWELLFAPHAWMTCGHRSWAGSRNCRFPLSWNGSHPQGIACTVVSAPHVAEGVVHSWSAMTGQHSRWRSLGIVKVQSGGYALHTSNRLPSLIVSAKDSDPLLAIGSRLISAARDGKDASLCLWLLGNEDQLQEKLRNLSSYSYGTEGGVGNDTPNSWACNWISCVPDCSSG